MPFCKFWGILGSVFVETEAMAFEFWGEEELLHVQHHNLRIIY
jgi:hypothetical protein